MTPLDGQNAFFRGLAGWVLGHRALTTGILAAVTGVALWSATPVTWCSASIKEARNIGPCPRPANSR